MPLNVWTEGAIPGKRGPSPEPGILFSLGGIHLTAHRESSNQRPVTLSEALDAVVLHADGTNFSARDVIEFLANKAGGAHFSEDFPRTLGSVMSGIAVGGLPAPAAAVVQFGSTALELGLKILRGLAEFDIDLVLAVRRPPSGAPATLFDARNVGAGMGCQAQLAPNLALTFGVFGVGGSFRASTQNASSWDSPHHVKFAHRITDHLTSEYSVQVDGELRSSYNSPSPIITYSQADAYEILLNRDFDSEGGVAEWAFRDFAMSPVPADAYGEAERLLKYRELATQGSTYRCFTAGSFLRRLPGTNSFEGDVSERDVLEWLAETAPGRPC